MADRIIDQLHETTSTTERESVRYPGERTLWTRKENLRMEIPVDSEVWDQIRVL